MRTNLSIHFPSRPTSGLGQPWPCCFALLLPSKRLQGHREEPSNVRSEEHLEQHPRSMRGFQTVNLPEYHQLLIFVVEENLITIIKFIFVTEFLQLLKVDFVSEQGTDATEPFYELIALAGTIGDEF